MKKGRRLAEGKGYGNNSTRNHFTSCWLTYLQSIGCWDRLGLLGGWLGSDWSKERRLTGL